MDAGRLHRHALENIVERVAIGLARPVELPVQLGIAFRLDDDTATKYRGYGIDLEKFTHDPKPLPADGPVLQKRARA